MITSKFMVAILVVASLMGGYRVENAAASYVANDARVLYLFAQIRMAVGDREGGLKLMRRAGVAEHQKSEYRANRTLCDGQSSSGGSRIL